jgi:hypothetical protein
MARRHNQVSQLCQRGEAVSVEGLAEFPSVIMDAPRSDDGTSVMRRTAGDRDLRIVQPDSRDEERPPSGDWKLQLLTAIA